MSFFTHQLKTKERIEFVNITAEIQKSISMSGTREGVCIIFIPHTTAAVTINEAADPAVVEDIVKEMSKIIPFHDNYLHSEGNSHAHIKSSLFGVSTQIPVKNGHLTLGTWQGVFFCEFDGPRTRSFHIRIIGSKE